MAEEREIPQIRASVLAQQVNEGWKRKALAEHYGLPETQMAQLLKDAGLTIRKFHAPKYQLIEDREDNTEEAGEDVNVVESEVVVEETVEAKEEVSTEASW